MSGRWRSLALSFALAGCSPRPAAAIPETCAPTSATLGAEAAADSLIGRYRVRLVATSGPRRDRTADGTLSLARPADRTGAAEPRRFALVGRGDLALEQVGAAPADVASADPVRPGALVFELPAAAADDSPRLLVRLGAEANRQDVTRVEGAYTVLTVRELGQQGFRGEWTSGAPFPVAEGYFCAWEDGSGER